MRKRVLAIMLSACMLVSMMPTSAFAAAETEWTAEEAPALEEGPITGATPASAASAQTVEETLGSVTVTYAVTNGAASVQSVDGTGTITIPAATNAGVPVTSIGDSAFEGCTGLTGIQIPETVTSIGSSAFKGCTGLTEIHIPDAVTTIGGGAFRGCANLAYANYPSELKSVGTNVGIFLGCEKLTSITVPEGVTNLPSGLFRGCTNFKHIILPSTLTSISYSVFSDCTGLTEIQLPETVTSIGNSAFSGCTGLTEIHIPDAVTTIGWDAFRGCANLACANYPSNLKSAGGIYGRIFSGCEKLTSITVPEGVTTVCGLFRGCTNFKHIILPSTLTSIGDNAFEGCTGLTEIQLPDAVTSIGDSAFKGCTGLTGIQLPETVTSIGDSAFNGCTGLTEIYIPDAVTTIGGDAFRGCANLACANYPSELKHVSTNGGVFSGCEKLTSITVPEGVTTVCGLFRGCTNFKHIILPSTLTSIGDNAFERCTGLTGIQLPDAVTSVGDSAFRGCTGLTQIQFPDAVTSIGSDAFRECTGLTEIRLPETVTSIGNYAFVRCTGLTAIHLPGSLTELNASTFEGCTALPSIYLPTTVTSFGPNVFRNCPVLTVKCSRNSYGALYCIDNGISAEYVDLPNESEAASALDRGKTSYRTDSGSLSSGGYISVDMSYGFKSEAKEKMAGATLTIILPKTTELIERSVLNGMGGDYNYDATNNALTFQIAREEGTVSLRIRPTDSTPIRTYAEIRFADNTREMVGISEEKLSFLTLVVSDKTDSAVAPVSGVGPANSEVVISVDGQEVATAQTNRSGNYTALVPIPTEQNYTWHQITATTKSQEGETLDAEGKTLYVHTDHAPKILDLVMRVGSFGGGNGLSAKALDEMKKRPRIVFNPGRPFTFEVSAENPDQIESVYITSTRGGIVKRMKAVWDEAANLFRATGWFDPDNHRYVPGSITVECVEKKEEMTFEQAEQLSTPEEYAGAMGGLSVPMQKMVEDIKENPTERVKVTVDTQTQKKGVISAPSLGTNFAYDVKISKVSGSQYTRENITQFGFQPVMDASGKIVYAKVGKAVDSAVAGQFVDFVDDKIQDVVVEATGLNGDLVGAFSDILGFGDSLIQWGGNYVSIDEARETVELSFMSPAEKAAALKNLSKAETINNLVLGIATVGLAAGIAGVTIPVGLGFTMAVFTELGNMLIEDIMSDFDYLGATGFGYGISAQWAIDPSGYVYDTENGERLEGIVTSAYWIPADDDDPSFWDNKPPEDQYGELWDVSEINAVNPTRTDEDGRYAWDVPEGWWRVKYEGAGYETTWSEWLPVPPPQTEVNIGMTAAGAAEYPLNYEKTDDGYTVTLTNHSGAPAQVLYILAVYHADGRMTTCQSVEKNLAADGTAALSVQAGVEDTIKAFVLEGSTQKPLRNASVLSLWKQQS